MKVTLYTTSTCPFCQQEKSYLQSKRLSFEEKNVELNKAYLDEMLQVGSNFAGVPVTKIEKDDGQTVVLKGFTQSEFDAALATSQPAVQAQSDDTAQPPAPTPEPTTPSVPPPYEPVAPTPAPIEPEPTITPPAPTPEPLAPTPPFSEPAISEPTSPVEPTQQQSQVSSDPLNSILKDLQNRMTTDQNQPVQPQPTPPQPDQPTNIPTPQAPQPTVPPLSEPTPTTPTSDQPPSGIPSIPDFPAK